MLADRAAAAPPGLTMGEGLRPVRWMTTRHLPFFKEGEVGRIRMVKMSGDGSKIVMVSDKGILAVNADGTGTPTTVSEMCPDTLDVSADGRKVAWYVRGQGVFVADLVAGDRKRILPPDYGVIGGVRLSGSGKYVVTTCEHGENFLYRLATDAVEEKPAPLVTSEQAAGGLGRKPSGAPKELWLNGTNENVDVSEDGGRIVFGYDGDVLALDAGAAPGNAPRNLTLDRPNVARVAVSGDGKKVAYQVGYPLAGKQATVTFVDWDGGRAVSVPSGAYVSKAPDQVSGLRLLKDGSRVLVAGYGLHLYGADGMPLHATQGVDALEGTRSATTSADGKRLPARGRSVPPGRRRTRSESGPGRAAAESRRHLDTLVAGERLQECRGDRSGRRPQTAIRRRPRSAGRRAGHALHVCREPPAARRRCGR